MFQVRYLVENWPEQSFKTCLYVCAHHAAVNLLAQNISRKQREQVFSQMRVSKETEMPIDHAARQEIFAILREELAALPSETAALLSFYHLDSLSVAEAAARTGLSVDACKQRLSRGREQLRKRLEKRGVALASIALIGLMEEIFVSAKA